REAECVSNVHIDHQIEFGWLFDRKIAWLGAAQNLVGYIGGAPEQVHVTGSIGNQLQSFRVPSVLHRRHPRTKREGINAIAVRTYERIGTDIKVLRSVPETLYGRRNILGAPHLQSDDFEAKRSGNGLSLVHLL